MRRKHKIITAYQNHFGFSKREVALFFLGVGLTLFILNMASMINMLEVLVYVKDKIEYPFLGFYISTLSSIILMGYSLFNLTSDEE
jgi:hypothetical protein